MGQQKFCDVCEKKLAKEYWLRKINIITDNYNNIPIKLECCKYCCDEIISCINEIKNGYRKERS